MKQHAGKSAGTESKANAHLQRAPAPGSGRIAYFNAPAAQLFTPIQMASADDRTRYYALQARLDAIFGNETLELAAAVAGIASPTAGVGVLNQQLANDVEKPDTNVAADLTSLDNWSISRDALLTSLPSVANYNRMKTTAGFAAQFTEFGLIMADFFANAAVDVNAMKGRLLHVDLGSTASVAFNPVNNTMIYQLDKANKITVVGRHKFDGMGSMDRPNADLISPSYSFGLTYGAHANFAVLHFHFDRNLGAATYVAANLGLAKLKVSDYGATINTGYSQNTPMITQALALIAGLTP